MTVLIVLSRFMSMKDGPADRHRKRQDYCCTPAFRVFQQHYVVKADSVRF